MKTVEELRKQGFKVCVRHNRRLQASDHLFEGVEYNPRGGTTVVGIDNGKISSVGVAQCSDKDHYNKKLGVRIAIGRALKNLSKIENI
jgi:hypothetical protein